LGGLVPVCRQLAQKLTGQLKLDLADVLLILMVGDGVSRFVGDYV
jgi:hypothetical protein